MNAHIEIEKLEKFFEYTGQSPFTGDLSCYHNGSGELFLESETGIVLRIGAKPDGNIEITTYSSKIPVEMKTFQVKGTNSGIVGDVVMFVAK